MRVLKVADLASVYSLGMQDGVKDQEARFTATVVKLKRESRAREEKLLEDLKHARERCQEHWAIQAISALLIFLWGFTAALWIGGTR